MGIATATSGGVVLGFVRICAQRCTFLWLATVIGLPVDASVASVFASLFVAVAWSCQFFAKEFLFVFFSVLQVVSIVLVSLQLFRKTAATNDFILDLGSTNVTSEWSSCGIEMDAMIGRGEIR